MGISNVSNGLRSGVCTSSTRPTAPYEGQMIYETDTNRVLVWDNAAWVMIADTDSPPGLQLIKTQVLSTGNSYTISDVFSSEFRNYLITGSFTRDTAGTAYSFIRLGASGTDHVMSGQYSTWNSGTRNGDNGGDGYAFFTGNGANSFTSTILAPNLAQYSFMSTIGQSHDYTTQTNVRVANSTQYTSFSFSVGTGNFTGGSIQIYGYRN